MLGVRAWLPNVMLLPCLGVGRSLVFIKLDDGPRPKDDTRRSFVGVTLDEASAVGGVGSRPDTGLLEPPKPAVGIRLTLVGVFPDGMVGIGVLRGFGVLRLVR